MDHYEIPSRILEQLEAFAEAEPAFLPLFSNAAALLYWNLEDVNWAGFYLLRGDELVLGPFQGKPACIRIPMGKGVCGNAAEKDRLLRVEDVHQFPGHIACDADSRSEIVIPLHRNGKVIGVLDIDSPVPSRFGQKEEELLAAFAAILEVFTEKVGDFRIMGSWESFGMRLKDFEKL